MKYILFSSFSIVMLLFSGYKPLNAPQGTDSNILSFEVDPTLKEIKFFWKNTDNEYYNNAGTLKKSLEKQNQKLIFGNKCDSTAHFIHKLDFGKVYETECTKNT